MATAKRDLAAGEALDGKGGFCVYGKLAPASASLTRGALPIGLAHGVTLKRAIPQGEIVCWDDVDIDEGDATVLTPRAMEQKFGSRI
jgi:predicted homoserine dehydrogenase-like protein